MSLLNQDMTPSKAFLHGRPHTTNRGGRQLEMIRTDNGEVIEGEVSQQRWRELALNTGERVFVRPKSLRVFPEPVE